MLTDDGCQSVVNKGPRPVRRTSHLSLQVGAFIAYRGRMVANGLTNGRSVTGFRLSAAIRFLSLETDIDARFHQSRLN